MTTFWASQYQNTQTVKITIPTHTQYSYAYKRCQIHFFTSINQKCKSTSKQHVQVTQISCSVMAAKLK